MFLRSILCFLLMFILVCKAALPLISNDEYLSRLAEHENDEIATSSVDSVILNVYTSYSYLAETNNTIYATFIGDFASSGPHSIGRFPIRGAERTITLKLDRKIGTLVSIYMENKNGYDGWLLRYLTAQIDASIYSFRFPDPLAWLSNFDAVSQSYDTDHQQLELPVVPLLYLPVSSEIIDYSATGN